MIEEYLRKNEYYTIIDYSEGLILTSHGKIFKKIDKKDDNQTGEYDFIEMPKSIFRDYEYIELLNDKNQLHEFYIHYLVFVLFKNPFDKRFFRIRHKNGDTFDNRAENLKIQFKRKSRRFIEQYENAINLLLDEKFL